MVCNIDGTRSSWQTKKGLRQGALTVRILIYKLKKGREDEFTKELWIDRREDSKSLAWSSVVLAYHNIGEIGEVVDRPKALGDIRGVSYIYGLFYRFGLIDVPEKVQEKMTM